MADHAEKIAQAIADAARAAAVGQYDEVAEERDRIAELLRAALPALAAQQAPGDAPQEPILYHGWSIERPLYDRHGPWTATHPSYDGPGDGGRYITGCVSVEDARARIDEWEDEHNSTTESRLAGIAAASLSQKTADAPLAEAPPEERGERRPEEPRYFIQRVTATSDEFEVIDGSNGYRKCVAPFDDDAAEIAAALNGGADGEVERWYEREAIPEGGQQDIERLERRIDGSWLAEADEVLGRWDAWTPMAFRGSPRRMLRCLIAEKLIDERNRCNGSCDIPLASLQVGPDANVPGNARECAELWRQEAARLRAELAVARQQEGEPQTAAHVVGKKRGGGGRDEPLHYYMVAERRETEEEALADLKRWEGQQEGEPVAPIGWAYEQSRGLAFYDADEEHLARHEAGERKVFALFRGAPPPAAPQEAESRRVECAGGCGTALLIDKWTCENCLPPAAPSAESELRKAARTLTDHLESWWTEAAEHLHEEIADVRAALDAAPAAAPPAVEPPPEGEQPDLLPCPFCAGPAELIEGPGSERWGSHCTECGVWRNDCCARPEDAAVAWNQRYFVAAAPPFAMSEESEWRRAAIQARADLKGLELEWGGKFGVKLAEWSSPANTIRWIDKLEAAALDRAGQQGGEVQR